MRDCSPSIGLLNARLQADAIAGVTHRRWRSNSLRGVFTLEPALGCGRGEAELEAIGKDVGGDQHASEAGLEPRCNAPPLSNAAKKYRGLLALRPKFFLAVAPGISRAYAVHYPDDRAVQTAELISIEGIPAATDQG